MKKVALIKQNDYTKNVLKEKIINGLKSIGFNIKTFKDARVALKPNLLMPFKAEKAVITHPEFFRALAEIVLDCNGAPVLIESPSINSLESTIKKVGYDKIAESLGIAVADIAPTDVLKYKNAKSFKNIAISKEFFNVDIIINMPKFKTHGFTYATGAVKNLFGAIPGLNKSRMHMKIPSQLDFSNFLLDLYGAFLKGFQKPKKLIHIMDAVLAMEGEGPGPAGKPRKMSSIIIGDDAVAVDCIAVLVAGLDIEKVFTITEGFKRDFCVSSIEEIQVLGEKIENMKLNDFIPSKNSVFSHAVRWPLTSKTFKSLFLEKPVPQEGKCNLCYNCKKICPAGAISKSVVEKKIPLYNYSNCIRCFCCIEICPEAALATKKGLFQWIMKNLI